MNTFWVMLPNLTDNMHIYFYVFNVIRILYYRTIFIPPTDKVKPLFAYEGHIAYDPKTESGTESDADHPQLNHDMLKQQVNNGYLLLSFKFLHNNNLFISINGGNYYCAMSIDPGNSVNLQQYSSQYKRKQGQPENLNVFTHLPENAEAQEVDQVKLAVGGSGPGDSFIGEIAEVSCVVC